MEEQDIEQTQSDKSSSHSSAGDTAVYSEESSEEEYKDESQPKKRSSTTRRDKSDLTSDQEYELEIPAPLQSLISLSEWKWFRQQRSAVDIVTKLIRACQEKEKTPAANDSKSLLLEDLQASSHDIGNAFGHYIQSALQVQSAFWKDHGKAVNVQNHFGSLIGELLEGFIKRQPVDPATLPTLEIATITGLRPVDPPPPIPVIVSPHGAEQDSFQTKRRHSTPFSPGKLRKKSRSSIAAQEMSEDDAYNYLEQYQTDPAFVQYNHEGHMQIKHIKNTLTTLNQGHRFITVPELVKLLLAEPWRVIAEKAFPFRIVDDNTSSSSIASILSLTKKSIEDFGYLIARWERQFWIQLPSEDKVSSVYPDKVDQEWILMYKKARQGRSGAMISLRRDIDDKLKSLLKKKKLLPSAIYDPGLMKIPEHIVQWMPTETRLLHDMAIRAAQNPTRYWSVFNPATHVFYRENLQYAFPVNPVQPSYAVPSSSTQKLFTKAIMKKYPIDEWRKEAKAEWSFYKKQLQVQFREPPIPSVEFPDHHKYRQLDKTCFQFARYAYFANDEFLDTPLDSDGDPVQVAKWTPGKSQWIEQPVTDHPINLYNRDDPDSNVWPPVQASPEV